MTQIPGKNGRPDNMQWISRPHRVIGIFYSTLAHLPLTELRVQNFFIFPGATEFLMRRADLRGKTWERKLDGRKANYDARLGAQKRNASIEIIHLHNKQIPTSTKYFMTWRSLCQVDQNKVDARCLQVLQSGSF